MLNEISDSSDEPIRERKGMSQMYGEISATGEEEVGVGGVLGN
jgi:hypothetical protein